MSEHKEQLIRDSGIMCDHASLKLVWDLMDSVLLNDYNKSLNNLDKLNSRIKYIQQKGEEDQTNNQE